MFRVGRREKSRYGVCYLKLLYIPEIARWTQQPLAILQVQNASRHSNDLISHS